jgi:hypothetical protein
MLESALTLVVFLAIFIGVFDVGTMLFVHQTLSDRARNAARWGAVNAFDATSIQNLVLYGATTQPQGQTGFFGLNTSNVVVSRPAATVGTPEDRIVVTVTYPVSLISVYIGRSATWSGVSVPSWNLQIRVNTAYEVPG